MNKLIKGRHYMLKVNLNSNRFKFKYKDSDQVYTFIPPIFEEPCIISWLDDEGYINAMVSNTHLYFSQINNGIIQVLQILD
tara:strand:+ start:2243 stop:2485 length:243 start_codon:yes stop_codon:yes gene_type:complete